jgi:hypothetical protein
MAANADIFAWARFKVTELSTAELQMQRDILWLKVVDGPDSHSGRVAQSKLYEVDKELQQRDYAVADTRASKRSHRDLAIALAGVLIAAAALFISIVKP